MTKVKVTSKKLWATPSSHAPAWELGISCPEFLRSYWQRKKLHIRTNTLIIRIRAQALFDAELTKLQQLDHCSGTKQHNHCLQNESTIPCILDPYLL